MVLCIIPPNFRPIGEILKELERERRSGRTDGRNDRRQYPSGRSRPRVKKSEYNPASQTSNTGIYTRDLHIFTPFSLPYCKKIATAVALVYDIAIYTAEVTIWIDIWISITKMRRSDDRLIFIIGNHLYQERRSLHWDGAGARLNIKIQSYRYRDPHVKDKTVSRLTTVLSLT